MVREHKRMVEQSYFTLECDKCGKEGEMEGLEAIQPAKLQRSAPWGWTRVSIRPLEKNGDGLLFEPEQPLVCPECRERVLAFLRE